MEIKDLERALKDPRGRILVSDTDNKPLKYGEVLYGGVYGEPPNGMDSATRGKANRIGLKIANALNEIDEIDKEDKEKRAEVTLIISAADIAFIENISTYAFNTMLFGVITKELENGKLSEEETEDP